MKDSQIKSKKRVKELGEVYTNEREVNAMLDLLPQVIWNNLDSKFLEPTCGNGNFIDKIVRRKLDSIPKNLDVETKEFLALIALSNVYGVDISEENIIETRQRVNKIVIEHFPKSSNSFKLLVIEILQECFIVADCLKGDFTIANWEYDVVDMSFQKIYFKFNDLKLPNPLSKVGEKFFY